MSISIKLRLITLLCFAAPHISAQKNYKYKKINIYFAGKATLIGIVGFFIVIAITIMTRPEKNLNESHQKSLQNQRASSDVGNKQLGSNACNKFCAFFEELHSACEVCT